MLGVVPDIWAEIWFWQTTEYPESDKDKYSSLQQKILNKYTTVKNYVFLYFFYSQKKSVNSSISIKKNPSS